MLPKFDDDNYDEIWTLVTSTGGKYEITKKQVSIIKEAMKRGSRIVVFENLVISIPYVTELFRVKRFLKKEKQLPEETENKDFKPVSLEKIEKLKRDLYKKLKA